MCLDTSVSVFLFLSFILFLSHSFSFPFFPILFSISHPSSLTLPLFPSVSSISACSNVSLYLSVCFSSYLLHSLLFQVFLFLILNPYYFLSLHLSFFLYSLPLFPSFSSISAFSNVSWYLIVCFSFSLFHSLSFPLFHFPILNPYLFLSLRLSFFLSFPLFPLSQPVPMCLYTSVSAFLLLSFIPFFPQSFSFILFLS